MRHSECPLTSIQDILQELPISIEINDCNPVINMDEMDLGFGFNFYAWFLTNLQELKLE